MRTARKRQHDRAAARLICIERGKAVVDAYAVDPDGISIDLCRSVLVPGQRGARLRDGMAMNEDEGAQEKGDAEKALTHGDRSPLTRPPGRA